MQGALNIITNDPYLGQKLRWELSEIFDRIEVTDTAGARADIYIFDCRLDAPIPQGEGYYYLTEDADPGLPEERCLPLPLPLGLAAKKMQGHTAPPLVLLEDERALRLYGEEIRLTEVEFSLLLALVRAEGRFLGREELRAAVWGTEGTDGLLSVYIHYLREKLERGGEKVILSSRKAGYALSEKFVKGDREC